MSRPDDSEGGFLGRWARRKQEAQRAALAPEPSPTATPPTAPAADQPPVDLPLPSLDSIVPGADVSAFFQAHVPEALRQAALRKLWTTDPEISGFIEMADYQWDFNNPDAIPGWGSRIDMPDVRRLAGRLLGGDDEEGAHSTDTSSVAEAAQDPEISGPDERKDPIPAVQQETASQPFVGSTGPTGPDDGAVQKTPSESVLYVAVKKRHGGALPS